MKTNRVAGHILGVSLLLFFSVALSSGIPLENWNTTFGGAGEEFGTDFVQTPDGGFLILGTTTSYGTECDDSDIPCYPKENIWLIKTDENGNSEWDKIFGNPVSCELASDIEKTSDGGYIIIGNLKARKNGDYSRILLIKIDSEGTEEWNRTYGESYGGYAFSGVETEDYGYLITGSYINLTTGYFDYYILKIANDTTEQWNKTYPFDTGSIAYDIEKTADGNYIILGYTSFSQDTPLHSIIMIIDPSGNVVLQKDIYGTNFLLGLDITNSPEGGYIFTGVDTDFQTDAQIALIKTDNSSNPVWYKNFNGMGYALSSALTISGTDAYIIAGKTANSAQSENYQAFLIKTNFSGDELWNLTLGGINNDEATKILHRSDGSLIILGTTESYGSGLEDIWLFKLGPDIIITPFPACINAPTDPDGDGIYEDTNGNGRKDFNDIVIFFKQMNWVSQNEPVECFDFNGNGRIDFNDVVMMFREM